MFINTLIEHPFEALSRLSVFSNDRRVKLGATRRCSHALCQNQARWQPPSSMHGDQKRQSRRVFTAGASLNFSPIRKPSTQKISPRAVAAKTKSRRCVAGTFAFTNKSCNFTGDRIPVG